MTFLQELPPHGPVRERAVADAVDGGRLDHPVWLPVCCGPVTLEVSADWLMIEGARIPMSGPNAQRACDSLEALLPTPKIVRAIEAAARDHGRLVPFKPWPDTKTQLSTAAILWREEQLPVLPASVLLAGCLKDVVIAPRLAWMAGRALLFGGLYHDGRRVQELQTNATAHEATFDSGYAGGVRAVRDRCTVEGAPARVSEILRDQKRAPWLSDEGPLSVTHYPYPKDP